mgnify:CR=1 FL=1
MAAEEQAQGYVERANAALGHLDQAEQIWNESVRSSTDEMRVHSLSIPLDNAIRKVEGPFDAWTTVDPSSLAVIADRGPRKLLQVLSAHPNGHIREAFIHCAADLESDQVLPHLANRALDFVPTVRQLATPLVMERLANETALRLGPGAHGALNTSVHIAVTKLLAPRTAVLNPELIRACIDVAMTATVSRPGALKEHKLEQMLERCGQTSVSITEPKTSRALADLVEFFEANAAT